MSSIFSQLGVKDESTYGTDVTVDRFYQFNVMGPPDLDIMRQRSKSIRTSGWVPRAGQQRVGVRGGTLAVELEWMTKGMGWWLKHMLGTTATGSATDSAYPHTGTLGSLWGDMFTLQGLVPHEPDGSDYAFTLAGCKVASWELACSAPDGLLVLKMELDFREYDDGVALATASYPASMMPYSWVDIGCTIAGSAFAVSAWSLKCDNNLKTDKHRQENSILKRQPTTKGQRKISFEVEGDFDSTTQLDRVLAANSAAASAAVVFTATCADTGTTIGAGTQPSTVITLPKASFDKIDGVGKEGPDGEGPMQKLSGDVLDDGSNSPVTILYTSADATA